MFTDQDKSRQRVFDLFRAASYVMAHEALRGGSLIELMVVERRHQPYEMESPSQRHDGSSRNAFPGCSGLGTLEHAMLHMVKCSTL